MQLMNRVAVNGGVRHSVRHVCGPAGLKQQAARTMPVRYVASADNAAAKMTEDDSFDKEEAYRRFEELLGDADVSFEQGDKITGTVFRVDAKGVYVDVGGKTTAFCPTSELSLAPVSRAAEVVAPDAVREFYVLRGEGQGELTLSIKQLELEVVWQRLKQMMDEEITVTAPVVAVNRGGVLVDVNGVRAFCPGSQLARRVQNFESLIGQEMEFKIIEADAEKSRLMLSNKRAVTSDAAAQYNVGDVVAGTVMSVKPYGAFIDLGGMSGLLHISQISHDRVMDVEKVLAVGDTIKVMVLSQDQKRGRLGLCTKKLEPTPGDMLRDPALVYEKAEEMAELFKQRVEAAEAAAREGADVEAEETTEA